MQANVTKDIVVLLGGVLLTLALESQRAVLEHSLGPERTSLFCFLVFAALIAGYLAFRHYVVLLGAGGAKTHAVHRHKAYEDLRASLSAGGTPARIYAQWLEKALHAVEHFLGDQELRRRSVPARAIGLRREVPLWTAPALDRSILLAFAYPQATIFLIWVISGRVGPAETVAGLPNIALFWLRFVSLATMAIGGFAYFKCHTLAHRIAAARKSGAAPELLAAQWRAMALWFVLMLLGAAMTDTVLGVSSQAIGGSILASSAIMGAVEGDVLVVVAAAIGGAAVGVLTFAVFGLFAAPIAACGACAAVALTMSAVQTGNNRWSRLRRRLRHSHLFSWLFLGAVTAVCIVIAREISATGAWSIAGPIVLFYGLLSAINAPFLWLSLGLTRALLWLGLEREGWWPYFFALLDATVAVLVIMVLVVVMVTGVQVLNTAAVLGGGTPVLAVSPLLDGIAANPAAPQYWWIYALLLSTMIPSLLNLAIGGFSLVRGIPILSRYLHAHLPKDEAVAPEDRTWIALILMFQLMGGICLGIVAQFVLLPWWIFGHILPGLGIGVLQFARSVAAGLPKSF
jgi:hypothetical protein